MDLALIVLAAAVVLGALILAFARPKAAPEPALPDPRLDDVIRGQGAIAEQFRQTTEEVAGADLKNWFQKALASTAELDYAEALEWYGLQFDPTGEIIPAKKWRLEVHPDATEQQRSRLKKLIEPKSAAVARP